MYDCSMCNRSMKIYVDELKIAIFIRFVSRTQFTSKVSFESGSNQNFQNDFITPRQKGSDIDVYVTKFLLMSEAMILCFLLEVSLGGNQTSIILYCISFLTALFRKRKKERREEIDYKISQSKV